MAYCLSWSVVRKASYDSCSKPSPIHPPQTSDALGERKPGVLHRRQQGNPLPALRIGAGQSWRPRSQFAPDSGKVGPPPSFTLTSAYYHQSPLMYRLASIARFILYGYGRLLCHKLMESIRLTHSHRQQQSTLFI